MKTIRSVLPALLLLLVACAGAAARQHTALPAMKSDWAQLRPGVERELAVAPSPAASAARDAADVAMASGDAVSIQSVNWPLLEAVLEDDVVRCLAAGKLGPLGAESRRGLIAEFAELRAIYVMRTP